MAVKLKVLLIANDVAIGEIFNAVAGVVAGTDSPGAKPSDAPLHEVIKNAVRNKNKILKLLIIIQVSRQRTVVLHIIGLLA